MADQTATDKNGLPPPQPDRLTAFVATIVRQIREAKTSRMASGIEEEWIEDEEHYQGIDDTNRAYHRSWLATVKRGILAPPTDGATSVAFVNITRPIVDTGAARVADILLPQDDRAWELKTTPIADLEPAMVEQLRALKLDPDVLQQEEQDKAQAAAMAMQDEIDDHFVECNWHSEVRKVIEDAARIGSGVLKGPFPAKVKVRKLVTPAPTLFERLIRRAPKPRLEIGFELKPISKWVSVWNLFPDKACGEDVHLGSFIAERDYITPRTLQGLLGLGADGGYNDAEIRAVLKEGPKAYDYSQSDQGGRPLIGMSGQFEMWTWYGQVQPEDMKAAGAYNEDIPEDPVPIDAMALLVNDRLIKVTFNAMDTGEFPYDVLAWQRRPGMPWGTGISRHGRTAQRMVNAGTRQMLDNGALACAPQVVVADGVTPSDGKLDIRGRKVWKVEAGGPIDVRAAFASFVTQSVQRECMGIIEFGLRMMEETTGMPSILSGQEPEKKETLGQAQLRVNNASGVMRRLAKRFDDYITKPHVRRYYDWFMQYSDRQDIKGDFDIDVRASAALVERDSQLQFMLAMMQFAKDPVYGISPRNLVREITKSNRMDPNKIMVPDEEYQGALGPTPLDEAKTKLLAAQADAKTAEATLIPGKIEQTKWMAQLTQAKSVREFVTAMYEAFQGAEAVSALPQITPIADGILRAADFPNALPAPAQPDATGIAINPIKNRQTGVQFTPGAENTHPAFPPNPQDGAPAAGPPAIPGQPAQPPQGDVGVQSGIEGGA